ncbi:MAG TPA: BTAD domain-containing putative transcriptional regulator, partial [Streptosporangiaceae bacterium]
EQLSQSHLDLLRLDGRWEAVAELDPGDERAHLALMRRHAANGDRHAALRQFDRLDRALRQELGLAPARRLRRCGTGCSPRTTCSRAATAR